MVIALYDELSSDYAREAADMPPGRWRDRFLFALQTSLDVLEAASSRPAGTHAGAGRRSGRGHLFRAHGVLAPPRPAASSKKPSAARATRPKPPLAAALGRLLYLVHLAVLLWWLLDKSANQRATAALVSLTRQLLPSAALALRVPPVRRFVLAFDELVREALFSNPVVGLTTMFLARRPSPAAIARFLEASKTLPLSYAPIGIVTHEFPHRRLDELTTVIGHGAAEFARARAALIRHLGFWSLNGCRVVYHRDGSNEAARFGVAYGTLTNHAEGGEELFEVFMDPRTEDVVYRIRATSWPQAMFARVGQPIVRVLQARFRHHSAAAMTRAENVAAIAVNCRVRRLPPALASDATGRRRAGRD